MRSVSIRREESNRVRTYASSMDRVGAQASSVQLSSTQNNHVLVVIDFFSSSISHKCPFNVCKLLEPVKDCCGINTLGLLYHCYIHNLGSKANVQTTDLHTLHLSNSCRLLRPYRKD